MKKDYLVGAIAGFITALLVLPSLKNIQVGNLVFKISLPFVVPILWVIGLWKAKFLSRWFLVAYQFGKFVIVGFLNTAIDFGVLNIISMSSGVTAGFLIGGVNIPGFILAATNSYFWNKFWVFGGSSKESEKKDYSDFFTFFLVVLIGLFINGGIVILVTTFVNPMFGLSPERWLNIAKVGATVISLFWNFVGFKFLVFKK